MTSVLKELKEKYKTRANVTRFVRDYVEGMGRVHEKLRSVLQSDVTNADLTYAFTIDLMKEKAPFARGAVALSFAAETEIPVDSLYVTMDLVDRRKNLEMKNRLTTNLSTRYVSGQCPGS